MPKTGYKYYGKTLLKKKPKSDKNIQNFGEKSPPKVDACVDGRGAGHPFEAEATSFFGGGARARSRADRGRIRGPAAWRRRNRCAWIVSGEFGLERRGLEALQKKRRIKTVGKNFQKIN